MCFLINIEADINYIILWWRRMGRCSHLLSYLHINFKHNYKILFYSLRHLIICCKSAPVIVLVSGTLFVVVIIEENRWMNELKNALVQGAWTLTSSDNQQVTLYGKSWTVLAFLLSYNALLLKGRQTLFSTWVAISRHFQLNKIQWFVTYSKLMIAIVFCKISWNSLWHI